MEKYQLRIISLVAILAFCLFFFLQGGTFCAAVSSVGLAVTVACVAYYLYRNFIWKIDPILNVPNLSNIKEVVIEFDHARQADGVNPAPEIEHNRKKAIIIDVSQHICEFTFTLHTNEMESNIFAGRFIKEDQKRNRYTLYYIYKTLGKNTKFNDQFGACRARYDPELGYWIGDYWTNQLTRGRIHFADLKTVKGKTKSNAANEYKYLM